MSRKGKKLSLADKISSLVTAAPTSFNSDDEFDDTTARLVDHDDEHETEFESEVPTSKFRTQNLNLLDDIDRRYKGKKVSRKTLKTDNLSSDSGEDLESNESNDENGDAEDSNQGNSTENDDEDITGASDESGENDGADSDDEPELDIDESNPLRRGDKRAESNFRHMSATDVGAEIEKGKCVRSQLGIWENLLEMRIKLQKCLISSNKMPQFDVHRDLKKADNNFSHSTNEAKTHLSKLLDNLLNLQGTLLKSYPETEHLTKDNSRTKKEESEDDLGEEIPSDTEDEAQDENEKEEEKNEEHGQEEEDEEMVPRKKRKLKDYESLLSKNHNFYSSYRNSVIQKWNDKTRVAVGNVNTKGSTQPVVKQIEYILSDKSKLRKRTQLKRSEYEIVGKQSSTTEEDQDGRRLQEYDSEIYDDDDFYHQLLRELIEFKSADVTDPIQLSKQWIQLQNMRSKMKRKIDTKATKGRRIRFGVHSKLVNFMAPITTDDLWSDEAKTELYNSLFGKIKETEEK